MIKWLRSLFHGPTPRMRELVYVPYDRADRMLREKVGWRLAPEENGNRTIGMVFLERDTSTVECKP